MTVCVLVFFFQRKLQYFPNGTLHEPASYGLEKYQIVKLSPEKDISITNWFYQPRSKHKVIVYFHGNAGNIGERSNKLKVFSEKGKYGIFAMSYRGYPGSDGSPKEKSILKDAREAIKFLNDKGYKNSDIILYGESLGSGIAVRLASEVNPYAVILEAPLYSVTRVARGAYWYLPVDILLLDRYNSYKYAPKIKSNILVFHGTKDRVIPYQDGRDLYNLFPSNDSYRKRFHSVSNAGHLDFSDEFLLESINNFLDSIS
jgi:uncharacterized protein